MRNPKKSFPLFIPEQYPSEMIYKAFSITKDMDLQRGIKKNKTAFFAGLIQKMAEENRIKTV